jgi:DNA invertase Pin-like site-specific DNA recombinase
MQNLGAEKISMIYGYARISTDGQSVTAQVAALRKHGAGKVFREVAGGAKTDPGAASPVARPARRRRRGIVARLDRLARSTRDLLNVLATISPARRPVSGRSATHGPTPPHHTGG